MLYSFAKGRLYTRFLDKEREEMFFPDEENVPKRYRDFHAQMIADFSRGVGTPYFAGRTDTAQNGEVSGAGIRIEFKRTSDEDLKFLFENWDGGITIERWIHVLETEHPDLRKDELDRIKRLAKPFIKTED